VSAFDAPARCVVVTAWCAALLLAGCSAGHPIGEAAPSPVAAVPAWCAHQPHPEFAALERVPISADWFQVYRIDPGVYAIAEPHQWQEVISYLIVGDTDALLFDTGMGIGDIRAAARELTGLPIVVLNSHTHFDHVGGNWEFDRIYALSTEFTRANARGATHGAVAGELTPDHLCGRLPAAFDSATYHTRPFRITDTVADGSIVDLGGRQLEVLHVPGHAPDALALLDAAHGLVFTGDTFYEGPIYVFGAGADFSAFTGSVERLAALAPRLRKVLASHNIPVSDPTLLLALRDAARAIARGSAKAVREENLMTYGFGRFSIVLPVNRGPGTG
jgi:glyoxylase-like metal-dependent hydrolase (beta-lactamase superfamily II)